MNIEKSLTNPYELTSWVPNTDCCEWYVVKCDRKTNRIKDFSLFQSSSFDLTKVKFPKTLTWLDLSHNKIFGRLPEEIKGSELELLNVRCHNLCGKLPYGGKTQSFHNTASADQMTGVRLYHCTKVIQIIACCILSGNINVRLFLIRRLLILIQSFITPLHICIFII
ncbi:hypothetical protein MKX01_019024 [Papaver californicum]|nr:hypothetical protein MKX01_019024 [Papaver californicum]